MKSCPSALAPAPAPHERADAMRWTVIEHAGRPVSAGPSALLAAPGGTIGRSPGNHLVLPDEQRQISRLQATVRIGDEGAVVLRNMSAVLSIRVNGRTLTHEQEARVADGDLVTIGSYVLEAASPDRAASAAVLAPTLPTVEPEAPMPDWARPAVQASPIDEMMLPPASATSDVFSDLFGAGALPLGETEPAMAMPPPVQPTAPAPAAAPKEAVAMPLPPPAVPSPASPATAETPSAADWDAILANAPRRVDSTPAPMPDPLAHEPFELPSQAHRNPVDPLAELNPGAAKDLADMALKRGVDPLSLFAADDNAPSPLSDPRLTGLTHEQQPLSALHAALDLLATPRAAPAGYNHSNHARELAGQFRPPVPAASPSALQAASSALEAAPPAMPAEPVTVETPQPPEPAVTAQPMPTHAARPLSPPPPSPALSSEELLQAFLEGAGVPEVTGRQPFDAEAMQRLGRLMRAFTDGTIELLSSRALLKREVHAEITMIVDEENNPFKILPNGRAVLMQMFGARMPGFLLPEAAVHDALGDLQSHQLGMVAGMRAALLTLLQRFDPARLDSTTPHDGSLGEKLLPGGRAARLWRQLQQLHTDTSAAVEDDFQAVFGRAFQQAYDREMERLKEARRA